MCAYTAYALFYLSYLPCSHISFPLMMVLYQCFCSNSDDYDKHGTSRNCSCCGTNVGANKMCVYKLQPTSSSTENENVVGGQVGEQHDEIAPGCMDKFHDAPYLGCYEDRQKDRALSHKVMGRYHDAKTCHVECNKLGYRYFARQWRGQCFCGNEVCVHCCCLFVCCACCYIIHLCSFEDVLGAAFFFFH